MNDRGVVFLLAVSFTALTLLVFGSAALSRTTVELRVHAADTRPTPPQPGVKFCYSIAELS